MDAMLNADDVKTAETPSEDEMTEKSFLAAYKKKEYPKPSLTADIAVFRHVHGDAEVLLIRRAKHPYRGCWALPGGFVESGEDVVDAAQRELEEETGVADVAIELFGIYGAPGRDPRGWTVSGGFCTLLGSDVDVCAGDDAADARWCAIREAAPSQSSLSESSGQLDGAGDVRVLEVDCGEEAALGIGFELVAQRFGAPRARVVESGGFAFDHAQLIADAYLKLGL